MKKIVSKNFEKKFENNFHVGGAAVSRETARVWQQCRGRPLVRRGWGSRHARDREAPWTWVRFARRGRGSSLAGDGEARSTWVGETVGFVRSGRGSSLAGDGEVRWTGRGSSLA